MEQQTKRYEVITGVFKDHCFEGYELKGRIIDASTTGRSYPVENCYCIEHILKKNELSIVRAINSSTLKYEFGLPDVRYDQLFIGEGQNANIIPETISRNTGLTDANGKKIFENDVYREENLHDGLDLEERNYYICTWIQEECMFGWLSAQEFIDYLEFGIDILNDCGVPFNCTEKDAAEIKIIGSIHTMPFEKILQHSSEYDERFYVKKEKS